IAFIASVERRRVWAVGLRWGLGHSLGVVVVGLIAGLLAQVALVDPLSNTSERLVGIMLLAIGAWGFWRLGRTHATEVPHVHSDGQSHTPTPPASRRFAPYAIGILHGCAGGSHLVGILLALAFPTVAGVLAYLAGFVAGSVLAMCAFAAGIGWLSAIGGVSPHFQRGLVVVSSLASISVGCWWLVG
ncbi:MAG TPA: High-affinity nickel transporter, partial [Planctomycetota bacterium]|nr:High-affinity nickel transporter [Planctomycetota bacterium]